MPRKAQPIAVPSGQRYGARSDLARAQQALPLPATSPPTAGTAPAPAPGAPSGGGGLAGAMADLQQMAPLGPLQGGTDHMASNVPRPITTMPPPVADSAVARYLPMLETAANAPNASWVLKQYVRRLRASTPATTDLADPTAIG